MNEREQSLPTGEAAQLLGVHRSTVKRWCDGGELSCSVTEGGHRRIALSALLSYAERQALECSLLEFNDQAQTVWGAVRQAEKEERYEQVVQLTYQWLRQRDADFVQSILAFVREREWPLPTLFDRLICSVMYQIGEAWNAGEIHVGDEHRMSHQIFQELYDMDLPEQSEFEGASTPLALVGAGPGNRHEMGALMVRQTLQAEGWQTVYLGADVPTRDFALQQAKHGADLVCISLTPPEHVASDAERILETLARLPDDSCPYRVALGGQAVEKVSLPATSPFLDARVFSETKSFVEWVRSFTSSAESEK